MAPLITHGGMSASAVSPAIKVRVPSYRTAHPWSAVRPELDFVHYEGKQSAYSSRLNKRD